MEALLKLPGRYDKVKLLNVSFVYAAANAVMIPE
jgi:hypothetical protein